MDPRLRPALVMAAAGGVLLGAGLLLDGTVGSVLFAAGAVVGGIGAATLLWDRVARSIEVFRRH